MLNDATQTSKLLPSIFQRFDPEQTVTVFHIGLALPETVDFFADYRCKLHFIDLLPALPIAMPEEGGLDAIQQFRELLDLPSQTQFDLCLFWDLFNFLDSAAIKALLTALRPHLTPDTMAHAFSVHNPKAEQRDHAYGILQQDTLSVRARRTTPPCYAPHSQRVLTELLGDFRLDRSVLLPDSRLEMVFYGQP